MNEYSLLVTRRAMHEEADRRVRAERKLASVFIVIAYIVGALVGAYIARHV